MKLIILLLLLFLSTSLKLNGWEPSTHNTFPVYTIKDIGEAAYFLNERLHKARIPARTVIMSASSYEILYNHKSLDFINNSDCERAYCLFVATIKKGALPAPNMPMLALVDVKGYHVFIAAFHADGYFIDLKPFLFPCKILQ